MSCRHSTEHARFEPGRAYYNAHHGDGRGIAWRAADSFALRDFLDVGLEQAPPDHSTISRTRRLIDLETHRAVFTWVLQCPITAGLVKGKTIGIDATTPRSQRRVAEHRAAR